MSEQKDVIFREVQSFGLWIRLFSVASMLFGVVIMLYAKATSGSLNEPLSILLTGGLALLLLGLAVLFFVVRLETEVRRDGLYFRFFPIHIHYKKLRAGELVDCYARQYRPIREYGGWGIRCGLKGGRAYNVKGNRGVQLVLDDGRRLLIGSQKPDQLAEAITSLRQLAGR
ncbi:MAG TPA: DUF6141 family protein [Sedimentisphaerales bacterium]|nr:DUF6141 family protein [Sedimentisphaerales bacterium]